MFGALSGAINLIEAQTVYKVPPPQVVPSSPQSAMFEKYINHEITEYNGLPQIVIPLFKINLDGLIIPIDLTYHAGGIKFGQYDGDVGAGWSINAEGYRITRTIYGKADEESVFYDPSIFSQNIQSSEDPYEKDTYLASIACLNNPFVTGGPNRDGEYDQFTYMLPSTEGHFIISDRNTKSVDIIENNPDKITLDEESVLALKDLKIVDKSGFCYYFGTKPDGLLLTEWASMTSLFNYKNGWPLKQIVTPNNNLVNFRYKAYLVNLYNNPNLQAEDARLERFSSNNYTTTTYASVGEVDYQNLYKEFLYVEEIATDNVVVKFIRNNQNIPYLVSEIQVYSKSGILIKKVLFEYGVSPAGANINSDKKNWHNLLKSITIGVQTTEKKYIFDYYSPPSYCGYPDQWGYYGEQSFDCDKFYFHKSFQNLNITSSSYNYGAINNLTRQKLGQFMSSNGTIFRYNWPDRSKNDKTPNFYSLKKIIFPTGGTTEYIYEPHRFKTSTNSTTTGGGQRIKKIISRDENKNPITTEFQYGVNGDGIGISNLELSLVNFTDYSYQFLLQMPPEGSQSPFYTFSQVKRFSTVPVYSDISNFQVNYDQISTFQYDSIKNEYNGKTISIYEIPHQYSIGYWQNYCTVPYFEKDSIFYRIPNVSLYRIGAKPILVNRSLYNEDSELIQNETYSYKNVHSQVYSGVKIAQKAFFNTYQRTYNSVFYLYQYVTSLFDYMNYSIQAGKDLLETKTTTKYQNDTEFTMMESFEYNDKNQITKETRTNSINSNLETYYKYPYNYSEAIYVDMANKNMISSVIERYSKQNNIEIGRIKANYTKDQSVTTGLILPEIIQTSFSGINGLTNEYVYNLYDKKGNPLQFTGPDGIKISLLWAYNLTMPVVKAENISYDTLKVDIESAAGTTDLETFWNSFSNITTNSVQQTNWKTFNTNLRNSASLANAQVSTYTYLPLVGMTSQTDPNGVTTYYEYDSFGRLKCTKDDDGNILKQYDYHYSNPD